MEKLKPEDIPFDLEYEAYREHLKQELIERSKKEVITDLFNELGLVFSDFLSITNGHAKSLNQNKQNKEQK